MLGMEKRVHCHINLDDLLGGQFGVCSLSLCQAQSKYALQILLINHDFFQLSLQQSFRVFPQYNNIRDSHNQMIWIKM